MSQSNYISPQYGLPWGTNMPTVMKYQITVAFICRNWSLIASILASEINKRLFNILLLFLVVTCSALNELLAFSKSQKPR